MFVRAEQVGCSVAEGIGLRARLEDLEGEKRELEARHERLKLPAVDWELVDALVENFERVMADGPPPQKKHRLHRPVKKVQVHDRRTVEVWYGSPNPQRFEDYPTLGPTSDPALPRSGSCRLGVCAAETVRQL